MDEFEVSIINYLGKVKEGIVVLISLTYDKDVTFDATFYYTEDKMILTVPEEIEEAVGDFKELPQYPNILRSILRKVVPYNEMIDRIDPLDVRPYLKAIFPDEKFE